jgi:hypothetical protein
MPPLVYVAGPAAIVPVRMAVNIFPIMNVWLSLDKETDTVEAGMFYSFP